MKPQPPPMNTDPLSLQLTEEAKRFDPQPPPGVRRRVLAAIAALPETPASRFPRATFARWSLGAVAVVTVAIVAVVFVVTLSLRHRPSTPVIVQAPQTRQWVLDLPSPGALSSSANPILLAQRWVQDPLEDEMHHLLTGLTQAGHTVTQVLPAAVKRTPPAPPAAQDL